LNHNFPIRTAILSAALAASTFAGAQSNPGAQSSPAAAPKTSKVAIVSIQDAIMGTNEGKKEADALKQRFGSTSTQLQAEGEAFEKDKAALQATADKLNETERNTRAKQINDREKTLKRKYEDFQGEVQAAEQEVLNRLGGKMLGVLDKYAKANGYSVVLDVSNPQANSVLWASQTTDITKELIEAYNAQAPAAAAPAAGSQARKPATSKPAAPAAPAPKKP